MFRPEARRRRTRTGYVLASLGTLLITTSALAQDKCRMSITSDPAHATYTEQHVIDVDDVPGHQIRIFELHRIFPDQPANCEGVRLNESWSRVFTDYVDLNGSVTGYITQVLRSGDKIFGELSGTSTTIGQEGAGSSTFTGYVRYTGGTGAYAKIRGGYRQQSHFNPATGSSETVLEIEYRLDE